MRLERARYAATPLGGLREREDWTTSRETLIAWVECGFQLVRSAERNGELTRACLADAL